MAGMNHNITLCMMVMNEERYLEACLAKINPYVKEIIIIDTGSHDSTLEIARRYTSNIYTMPFEGDYSQIRNAAIEKVKTEWVLFLDADEEFESSEAEKLSSLVEDAEEHVSAFLFTRYNFFSTGGWYSNKVIKLFRNHEKIRYAKKINESLEKSISELGHLIRVAPIILNHYGHCRSVAERNAKSIKYIALMQEQLLKAPEDAILHAFIGITYRTLGEFTKAIEKTNQALQINPEMPILHCFHGHALRAMGRNEEALASYKEAVRLRPNDASFKNMVGVTYLALENLEYAENAFKEAYALEPSLPHILINLGLVRQFSGDFANAYAYYSKASQLNPGFLRECWIGRVECDPYRPFYYETVMNFSGLGYHLAYCLYQTK